MPYYKAKHMRVLVLDETDQKQGLFWCPVCERTLPNEHPTNPRSEEDLMPCSLGGGNWLLALCKECNNGFSNRFEQKFTEQPWVQYGIQRNKIKGRRKSTGQNIGKGYARTGNQVTLNRLRYEQDDLKAHAQPLPPQADTDRYFAGAPEFMQNDDLAVHRIPVPVPTVLEATKMAFEQIFWHFDTQFKDLAVVQLMREVLQIQDAECHEDMSKWFNSKQMGYQVLMDVPDPNPTRDGKHINMTLRLGMPVTATADVLDRLELQGARERSFRSQDTHLIRTQVKPADEQGPDRLEIHFDFAHTVYGQLWFRLQPEELSCGIKVENWVNWKTGKPFTLRQRG